MSEWAGLDSNSLAIRAPTPCTNAYLDDFMFVELFAALQCFFDQLCWLTSYAWLNNVFLIFGIIKKSNW
jgi:hypothetical protein